MKHIGRNIISLLFSRVIASVILFLIYTRLAQYLGPEASGQFGVLSVYLTVFSFFVDLGMSQLVIKKVSEDQTHAAKYLTNYFYIQTGLGVGFMILMDLLVVLSDYPGNVKSALYVAGFGLLFSSMSLPFRSIINAFQRLTVIAKVNFFNSVINGAFMVLAIAFHKNIFFLSFISVAVSIFDIIVYWIVVHKRFVNFSWKIDWKFVKQLFIATLPFTLLTLFSVYNRIDTLVLSHLRDFVEVGYYSVAYKFWDALAFVPSIIGISLYPFYAHAINRGELGQVKKGLETYLRYMAAIALPLSVGAYLLAKPITVAFYGPAFAPAAPALWLLVTAVSVLILYCPINSLVISQQTKKATWITGGNLLFNFVANIILIAKYGFVAAACVTVASEVIQLIGYTYLANKYVVKFNFFKTLAKPFFAAIIMGVAVKFLDQHSVWLAIAAGGIVYCIALFVLRFFEKSDWELFRAAADIRKPLNVDTPPTA